MREADERFEIPVAARSGSDAASIFAAPRLPPRAAGDFPRRSPDAGRFSRRQRVAAGAAWRARVLRVDFLQDGRFARRTQARLWAPAGPTIGLGSMTADARRRDVIALGASIGGGAR
jgi:hypothetical protein